MYYVGRPFLGKKMQDFVDDLSDYLLDTGSFFVSIPINMGEKFYFVYLLAFVALSYLSYQLYYRKGSRTGFLRFLFPKRIYFSKSARIDYAIFLINILISPLVLVGAGLQAWLSIQIGNQLIAINDGAAVFQGNWSTSTYVIFIIGYTLVADLSVYIIHRLHHKSDILWPIHSLHHSAKVLTPVTLFRKHPLWNLTARLFNLTLTGTFQGVFIFFALGGPSFEILFGLNTLYVAYNFFGANLRHSHVWLSWGKPLSYIFISPAMHQIHHDPNRMRKNYGEMFAIWDWMFGTLYIPKKFETFEIGLANGDDPHNTVAKAYLLPLVDSWLALRQKLMRTNRDT
jgi:sterol desaturase/sphingolipid hydroxylase (fatty acid hydroxylase superfamily)